MPRTRSLCLSVNAQSCLILSYISTIVYIWFSSSCHFAFHLFIPESVRAERKIQEVHEGHKVPAEKDRRVKERVGVMEMEEKQRRESQRGKAIEEEGKAERWEEEKRRGEGSVVCLLSP